MNDDIEKIIDSAGTQNKYQYFTLFLIFFIYGTSEFITIAIPYLEVKPVIKINYLNQTQDVYINYSLCKELENNNITPVIVPSKTKSTIVYDFDIYCDQFYTTLIGTVIFSGILFGSLVSHFFSDNIGRKNTVILFGAILIITLFSYYIIKNLTILYINLFLSGFSYIIIALTSIILLNEVVHSNKRAIFTSIIYTAYSIFGIIYPLVFYYIYSWKTLFFIIGVAHLFFYLIFCYYTEESPRFLYSKRKINEFKKIIRRIAFKNDIPSTDLVGLEEVNIKDEEKSLINQEKGDSSKTECLIGSDTRFINKEYSMYDLIRYPSQRINFITLSFIWFTCSVIFYGLNINIKNLDGNIYFQGMFINSFEIFFVIASGIIANTEMFGRKKTISIYLLIALICLFILIFIPLENKTFDILLMTTRYSVSSVFCIISYVSSEIYPTVLRSKGLALNSVVSRLGGIIAPSIIENLDFRYVLIIYCILNLISLKLSFFLEETYNKPLKENIPEEIEKYH